MDERALTTQQRKPDGEESWQENQQPDAIWTIQNFSFFFFFDALHHGAAHQRGMHKTRHRER